MPTSRKFFLEIIDQRSNIFFPGGGVRQAAAVYGLQVTGVDLSANMLSEAIVRVHDEKDSRLVCSWTAIWPQI